MAVRHPGDDDRPTVDLGPRAPDDELDDPSDLGAEPPVASADIATRTIPPTPPVHAQPTQQLARRRAASESSSRYTTASSPVEAMRHDELERTRVFLRIAVLTSVAGIVASFSTRGDPFALRVVVAGAIATLLGSLWLLQLVRDPEIYTPSRIVPPAIVIAIGAFGGTYYWGCASPVAAMITYGIYFFSLGANARVTTAMYLLAASMHAALGVAIITGAIEDRGIVNMGNLPTIDQIGLVLVVEFLYFITFYTARVSQRVTLDAMSRLELAVRDGAQREALLAEARAELDRALVIGGPGRFTDQNVGSFKLGVLIGRGGMGEVYEAAAIADQRAAAVKLLHPGTLSDPMHVQRFIREADIASKLDCPHVVRVLEVGTTAGGVPFLAMERLRGHDLAQQLRKQRRMQLPAVKVLVDHVAAGLEAARTAGIVHRDLKPHNVFFAESDERKWKILDFGVSKAGGTGTLTRGHVVGTPAYMAPEQARGEDVDHRADVYSLAAIVYRAVTGHPAFTGKDVPTTLYDVVYRVPSQPSILAPVTGDLDRVLALGLAKHPRDRFATAGELARWLAQAIAGDLDPDQRRRADDVIAKHPWGTRQGDHSNVDIARGP